MQRLLLVLAASGLILGAVAFSGNNAPSPELKIAVDAQNPFNHLRMNESADDFHFAIVSDRTGGHRAKVFSRAVEYLNLMQPKFVISVGDLIEGYTEDVKKIEEQWKEFDSFTAKLQMPFFYVPGNHDITNEAMVKFWNARYGKRYYHFVYKNVLFLLTSSEDAFKSEEGRMEKEQIEYFKRVLDENKNVRWTFVAMHKPMWAARTVEKTGWLEMERALNGRNYTVFAGHRHVYHRYLRNGMRYYQLATTGGSSKMRGIEYGEFDHLVWITMRGDKPIMCNVMLDGILAEDLKVPDTVEEGVKRVTKPTHPVSGRVYYKGNPIPGAKIAFTWMDGKTRVRGDAIVQPDGTYRLSTYAAHDGAPAAEYKVTIVMMKPKEEGDPDVNLLPTRYGDVDKTPLTATIREGQNRINFELTD
jgi:predicted phosphodiesterase